MKLRTAIVAAVATLGLAVPGVAAAHGTGTHPEPTSDAAARAEAGLLAACKGQGFTALYTPIDPESGYTAPDENLPGTPYDDRDATAFTFGSREQCRNVVRAGLPVGLIARAPADLVTTPAPPAFPARPNTTPGPGADLTTEAFTDGANDFSFVVRGVRFSPGQEVTLIVNKLDDRPQVVRLGNADAQGNFTYRLVGTCHPAQRVTLVTAYQAGTNLADSVPAPAGLCV